MANEDKIGKYTRLNGSNISVEALNQDQTTSVAASASETVTISAPAGKVATIVGLYLQANAPASATTGTHQFTVRIGSTVTFLEGVSAFGTRLLYQTSEWRDADSAKRPADATAAGLSILGRQFDADTSLTIVYTNNTDVPQANNRIIRAIVRYEGTTN